MSVSITSCPSCKTLVLTDTIQCPSCHEVLRSDTVETPTIELAAVSRAAEDMVSCPDCGEMVRGGLVRCWRCGGFLRSEIAEKYQQMQESPRPVPLSEAPDLTEISSTNGQEDRTEEAGEDDFTLGDGISFLDSSAAPGLPPLAEEPKAETPRERAERRAAEQEAARRKGPVTIAPASQTDSEPETIPLQLPAETTAALPVAQSPVSPAAESKVSPAVPSPTAGASAEAPAPAASAPVQPAASTGDPLLDIALQEERESDGRRKDRRRTKAQGEKVALPGFLFVFCPNGHRIHVEEKYRGMTGRCPRCKSAFLVPALDWEAEKNAAKKAEEQQKKESRYKVWTIDAHLHQVDPAKLKLKPGSLEKEFLEVDLAFSADEIMVVSHGKQGTGLFSGEKNKKKREELRAAVQEHLRLEKEILDLPAAGYRLYQREHMPKIQVVQPAVYIHESMFAGVPVFGEGRIAVRLPVTDQDKDLKDILFVSFTLTEFREFGKHLSELYGVKDLGHMEGVPLTDSETEYKCHYSDRRLKAVEVTPFHKADSTIELEVIGHRCQACGLTVSEESRKKEKLGGSSWKGIAKAKCPKCQQKMGEVTLWGIKVPEGAAAGLTESGGVPGT